MEAAGQSPYQQQVRVFTTRFGRRFKMSRYLISVAMVAALIGLVAVSQDGMVDQQIGQVRKQLADLGLRVARLEHAGGVVPSGSDGSGADTTSPARSMVVGGIQVAEGQPMDSDAADDIQDDIDALQRTVNYHVDQAEGSHGYYDGGSYYGGGHAGRERRIVSQRAIANRYATQLAIKKQQLDKMQHAADMITQIIHGHDGETIITLKTMSDMSSELAEIEIGDVITWTGKREQASATSEDWYAESIEKIEDRYGK